MFLQQLDSITAKAFLETFEFQRIFKIQAQRCWLKLQSTAQQPEPTNRCGSVVVEVMGSTDVKA